MPNYKTTISPSNTLRARNIRPPMRYHDHPEKMKGKTTIRTSSCFPQKFLSMLLLFWILKNRGTSCSDITTIQQQDILGETKPRD
jgi:hypothetical protein